MSIETVKASELPVDDLAQLLSVELDKPVPDWIEQALLCAEHITYHDEAQINTSCE